MKKEQHKIPHTMKKDNITQTIDTISIESSEKNRWNESLINDFVDKVNSGDIVPIIGPNAYTVQGYNSVQEYIVKRLFENLYKKYQITPILLTDEIIKPLCEGFHGMTKVAKMLEKHKIDIYVEIREMYKDESFLTNIELKKNVKQFLQSGNFPLIITTCNFFRLESILPKYKENVIVYQLGQGANQRIPMNLTKRPCIFHIFGVVQRNKKAVITESHFLNYLSHIKDSNTEPRMSTDDPNDNNIIGLKDYLSDEEQEKYLLSIGCDIPNWTFRFLLASLKVRGGELLSGNSYENSFSGGALFSSGDEQLIDFLTEIGYFSDDKIEIFLEFINPKLSPQKLPKLFLSVNSEDYKKYGDALKEKLESNYDVWYFPNDGKKRYWRSIKKGLAECQYFMPVVTNTTIEKLCEPREEPEEDKEIGLITELHMALEEMQTREEGVFSIPFVLETSVKILKQTLLRNECPNKDLFKLFFPGNELLSPICLDNFSVEKLNNYLKNA